MHPIFSIHYWNIWQFSLSMFRNFPQTILLLLRLTSGKSLECCSTMSHFQWHQKRTKIYYKISWHRGWYLILLQTTCKSKLQDLITHFLLIWKFSIQLGTKRAACRIFNDFQLFSDWTSAIVNLIWFVILETCYILHQWSGNYMLQTFRCREKATWPCKEEKINRHWQWSGIRSVQQTPRCKYRKKKFTKTETKSM